MKMLIRLAILLCGLNYGNAYAQQWYYGDLHGHSKYSDGKMTVRQYFGFSKDSTNLDFVAITDHDALLSTYEWDTTKVVVDSFNSLGSIVTYLGFEWSSDTTFCADRFGHKCVYYPNTTGQKIFKAGDWWANNPTELFDSVKTHGGLVHANHPQCGYQSTNWNYHDDKVQTGCEIVGWGNGTFEIGDSSLPAGLKKGYHFGMIGSSDTHDSIGSGFGPGRRGLTAVYANAKNRDSIFAAIKRRHFYAVSAQDSAKSKTKLYFKVNGCFMGEICVKDTIPKIFVCDTSTSNLTSIKVQKITYDNVSTVTTFYPSGTNYKDSCYDSNFDTSKAWTCYYAKVLQNGDSRAPINRRDSLAWASPVWVYRTGSLKADTTRWSGVVHIFGDVTIPAGKKLIIEPGTVLKFAKNKDDKSAGVDANRCELIIEGTLIAKGKADDSIYFTSDTTAPAANNWYGIRCKAGSVDSFEYCSIRYGYAGITCDSGSGGSGHSRVYVDHCNIRNNQIYGIYCLSDSGKFSNSSFDSCGIYGMRFNKHGGRAENNTIGPGITYGVYITDVTDSIFINGNTIDGCGTYGVIVIHVGGSVSITGNSIASCAFGNIGCGSAASPAISGNALTNSAQAGLYCGGYNSTRPVVSTNEVYGNKYGVKAASGGMPEMNGGYNGVYSNTDYNVCNLNADSTVRAESNWWGSNPPDITKFYGKVDYDPWLTREWFKVIARRPGEGSEVKNNGITDIAQAFDIRPNPCHTSTNIQYSVTSTTPSAVAITVYNIAGELIRILVDGVQPQGIYAKLWDGRNGQGCSVASGIYVCRLAVTPRNGPPVVRTRRMLLVK